MTNPRCRVGALLHELDGDTAEALRHVLASDATAQAVSQVLKQWGHDVGHDSIQKHRRPLCKCR